MSIHQTPLLVGYFSALIFSCVLWWRAWRNESPAQFWLGSLLFLMAMEVQDYTFGFSGINFLWEELNGFPRHFYLAFAPTVYFYLKTQTNQGYVWQSRDWLHFLPQGIYFFFGMILFAQGAEQVSVVQTSELGKGMGRVVDVSIWVSYLVYFYITIQLYRQYASWIQTQFSATNTIDLVWLKQFIYLVIFGQGFKWLWFLIDMRYQLPFEQDWWWQLFSVFLIFWVGINSLSQSLPRSLQFESEEKSLPTSSETRDFEYLRDSIDLLMNQEEVYLLPELTLQEFSTRLKTNSGTISAAINQLYHVNFNDFVNQFRVQAFQKLVLLPENQHLTLLALGLMAGFNSKATFNRAVKKVTGKSPKEFLVS